MRAIFIVMLGAVAAGAAEPLAWRTDYSSGRKDAVEAKKPVCLVISSDNCVYCKKLEATTFADAQVNAALKNGYVPIKIDASREPELVKALRVNLYPTTVLAGHDGTIHAIINGYVAADQMHEHLKKTVHVIAENDRMEVDVLTAKAAFEAGDLVKSSALLRPIADAKDRPSQAAAKELLVKVERAISAKAVVQAVRPQALLDVAKTLHDHSRFAEALDVCAEVVRSHPGTAESKAASLMMDDIRSSPAKLATASRQADEKAAALQLALSESLLKQGDTVAAKSALEGVLRLTSAGPTADAAQIHLTKLRQPTVAIPATLKK